MLGWRTRCRLRRRGRRGVVVGVGLWLLWWWCLLREGRQWGAGLLEMGGRGCSSGLVCVSWME